MNNIIEDNSIVICPQMVKQQLIIELQRETPFKRVKFLSKEELKDGFGISCSEKALMYLHQKHNYSYENADEILANICKIGDQCTDKLHNLRDIYEELQHEGLIKTNEYFSFLFQCKKVYVIGYSKEDIEISRVLTDNNISFEYVESVLNNNSKFVVECFNQVEDEINNMFIRIGNLINDGVSLNNIFINVKNNDYLALLEKYFILHDLPCEFGDPITLYESPIFHNYLKYLDGMPHDMALEELQDVASVDHYGAVDALVQVLNILEGYTFEKSEFLEILIYLAKKKRLRNIRYVQSIKQYKDGQMIGKDDFLFVIGFNLGSYPTIKKDDDFLNDKEKLIVGRNTSVIENKISKERLINMLSSIDSDHLFISRSNKFGNVVLFPSVLISELNMNEIKNITKSNIRFSKPLSKIECAKAKDMKYSYSWNALYKDTYSDKEIGYRSFNNAFKWEGGYFNKEKLQVSYSSINDYYECPFRYYVNKVLELDEYETTLSNGIGSLFHKVLEDSYKKEHINLDDYKEEINKMFSTNREKFFALHILPKVQYALDFNNEFDKQTKFAKPNKTTVEKGISVKIDENTNLFGKIDKLYLYDNEDKYFAVVDYKTSDFTFKSEFNEFGLHLQLPIYILLTKGYKEFNGYEPYGIFIENILGKAFTSYQNIKMDGITLGNDKIAKDFNSTDSKKGLVKYSKTMTVEEMNELEKVAYKKVVEAVENIRKGKFEITETVYDSNNSCRYCEYKDICFKKRANIKEIVVSKGDDQNGKC